MYFARPTGFFHHLTHLCGEYRLADISLTLIGRSALVTES